MCEDVGEETQESVSGSFLMNTLTWPSTSKTKQSSTVLYVILQDVKNHLNMMKKYVYLWKKWDAIQTGEGRWGQLRYCTVHISINNMCKMLFHSKIVCLRVRYVCFQVGVFTRSRSPSLSHFLLHALLQSAWREWGQKSPRSRAKHLQECRGWGWETTYLHEWWLAGHHSFMHS